MEDQLKFHREIIGKLYGVDSSFKIHLGTG